VNSKKKSTGVRAKQPNCAVKTAVNSKQKNKRKTGGSKKATKKL
jgi:hypothetical protein